MQSLSCAIPSVKWLFWLAEKTATKNTVFLGDLSVIKHLVHASMAVYFSRKCLLSNTSYERVSQEVFENTEFIGNRSAIGGGNGAVS